MAVSCPACGSTRLRQITPGFFECLNELDRSMPPGMAGNPGWLHASAPCGHRFQVGIASETSAMCACGRYAIGRCQDCDRTLCGEHGTAHGIFLCGSCLERRAQEKRRREAEALRQAAEEAKARDVEEAHARAAASLALSGAESVSEIVSVMDQHGELLDRAACRAAWKRALEAAAPAPTHEIVRVSGWPHLLMLGWQQQDPGWMWHERGSRSDAWFCDAEKLYVDRDGSVWKTGTGLWCERESHAALPRGKRFRATPCPQSLGPLLLHHAKARTALVGDSVSQLEAAGSLLARTYASVLRSVRQAA